MQLIVFSFEVPEEKQADYLKATSEKIKPYHESHGTLSYDVWQSVDDPKVFIKTMLRETPLGQGGPPSEEMRAVVQIFESFAENESHKAYVKKA